MTYSIDCLLYICALLMEGFASLSIIMINLLLLHNSPHTISKNSIKVPLSLSSPTARLKNLKRERFRQEQRRRYHNSWRSTVYLTQVDYYKQFRHTTSWLDSISIQLLDWEVTIVMKVTTVILIGVILVGALISTSDATTCHTSEHILYVVQVTKSIVY